MKARIRRAEKAQVGKVKTQDYTSFLGNTYMYRGKKTQNDWEGEGNTVAKLEVLLMKV